MVPRLLGNDSRFVYYLRTSITSTYYGVESRDDVTIQIAITYYGLNYYCWPSIRSISHRLKYNRAVDVNYVSNPATLLADSRGEFHHARVVLVIVIWITWMSNLTVELAEIALRVIWFIPKYYLLKQTQVIFPEGVVRASMRLFTVGLSL